MAESSSAAEKRAVFMAFPRDFLDAVLLALS
jgi:hypothetical protein